MLEDFPTCFSLKGVAYKHKQLAQAIGESPAKEGTDGQDTRDMGPTTVDHSG